MGERNPLEGDERRFCGAISGHVLALGEECGKEDGVGEVTDQVWCHLIASAGRADVRSLSR